MCRMISWIQYCNNSSRRWSAETPNQRGDRFAALDLLLHQKKTTTIEDSRSPSSFLS
jgi:hypothetical protein